MKADEFVGLLRVSGYDAEIIHPRPTSTTQYNPFVDATIVNGHFTIHLGYRIDSDGHVNPVPIASAVDNDKYLIKHQWCGHEIKVVDNDYYFIGHCGEPKIFETAPTRQGAIDAVIGRIKKMVRKEKPNVNFLDEGE